MGKANIDLTKALRIGLTFRDADGRSPPQCSTWIFNFRFDPSSDLFTQEGLDQAQRDAWDARGLDLERHLQNGIDSEFFGELLTSSGIVLNDEVQWICLCSHAFEEPVPKAADGRTGEHPWRVFCGLYDLGYWLPLLTSKNLPDEVRGFYEALDLFFPNRCDLGVSLRSVANGTCSSCAIGDRDRLRSQQLLTQGSGRKNARWIIDRFFELPQPLRDLGKEKPSLLRGVNAECTSLVARANVTTANPDGNGGARGTQRRGGV